MLWFLCLANPEVGTKVVGGFVLLPSMREINYHTRFISYCTISIPQPQAIMMSVCTTIILGLIFLKIPSKSTGSLYILLSSKRYWDHPLQIRANPQSYCDPVYCTEELVLGDRLTRSPKNPIPQLCNNMRYLGSRNIWSFAHVLVTVVARC